MDFTEEYINWLKDLKGETLTEELIDQIMEHSYNLIQYAGREGYELAKEDIIETINRLQ